MYVKYQSRILRRDKISTADSGEKGGCHDHWVADSSQRHKNSAIVIVMLQTGGHGQRQCRLADTRWPQQRQQATTVTEQAIAKLVDFRGAAN